MSMVYFYPAMCVISSTICGIEHVQQHILLHAANTSLNTINLQFFLLMHEIKSYEIVLTHID